MSSRIPAPEGARSFAIVYWDGTEAILTPAYAEATVDLDRSIRVSVYGMAYDVGTDEADTYFTHDSYKDADDAPEWARPLFDGVTR